MLEYKKYHRRGKSKFLLKCHLIFVLKYRHDLLKHDCIASCVKEKLISLQTKEFSIEIAEVDKDHIHLLIDYVPQISISQIVRKLKQETTVELWNKYDFKKYLWKERTFWSDGYFVC